MDLEKEFELAQKSDSQVPLKQVFFFIVILTLITFLVIKIVAFDFPYKENINDFLLSILYTMIGTGIIISGYDDAIQNNIVKVNFISMPSTIYGGMKVLLGVSTLIYTFLNLPFIGLMIVPIAFISLYFILFK